MLKRISKNSIFIAAFAFLGALSLIVTPSEEKEVTTFAPGPSVDTFIPAGYVLVPLDVANAESLASLVGDLGGVVDLYLATTETQKGGLKVGSKLKILRAPLNPQQYAVLVKDSDSNRLLSYAGPFIAVVQNPQAQGTSVPQNEKRKIQISYQN